MSKPHSINLIKQKQKNQQINTSILTIQYQLSRNFIKYTRDQLITKQIQFIADNQAILDTISKKIINKKNEELDKDQQHFISFNTNDTFMTQQDQQSKIKPRPFSRKTTNNNKLSINSHLGQNNFIDVLTEIKQNCSNKTYLAVNSLIQYTTKIKKIIQDNKLPDIQTLHKNSSMRVRSDTERNGNDQIIILAAKNMKLEKQNHGLQNKIKEIQNSIQTINQKYKKNICNQTNQSFQRVKEYFDRRQHKLNIFNSKIDNIHKIFLNGLQDNLIDQGCSRCCTLIRKIKSSLINYKQCLLDEIQYYRELWWELNSKKQNGGENQIKVLND